MCCSISLNQNHGTWGDYLIEPHRWCSKQWEHINPLADNLSCTSVILRIIAIVPFAIATLASYLLGALGLVLKTIESYCMSGKAKTDPLQGLSDKMIPVYKDINSTQSNCFENLENILKEKIAPRVEKYFREHGLFTKFSFQINMIESPHQYITPGQELEAKIDCKVASDSQIYTNSIGVHFTPSVGLPRFDVSEKSIMKALMQFG